MMNKLSYVIMSVLFFNVLFTFYYYFKIISFLYIDLFSFSRLLNVILVNLFIVVLDVVLILLYNYFYLQKMSYLRMVFFGLFVGGAISLILLKGNYKFDDYLSIISYFIINAIFIYYSLYFDDEKKRVFE